MNPTQFVAVEDVSPTTLTYVPRVNPAPLTVSVPGRDPRRGSLEVVITNQTQAAVAVVSVRFTITVGTPGPVGTPLTPSTAGLEMAVSDDVNWALTGPATDPPVASGIVEVVLEKKTGASVSLAAGASVVVQIFGFATVPDPSTSNLAVKESLLHQGPQFTSFGITTFPDGFYFNGLIATTAAGAVAQVAYREPVTLKWNSSVVDTENVAILQSSAAGQLPPATPHVLGQWTTPAGLTADTVFVVAVQSQGLSAALSTAVSVQGPDVVLNSAATGTASITGDASIGGSLAAQAITATGVTVNGAISTAGAASFGGALTAGATTVTGALSATEGVTAGGPLVSSSGSSSVANLAVGEKITGQYLYLTWTPGFQTGAPGLSVDSSTWGASASFANSGTGMAVRATNSGPGSNPAGLFQVMTVPTSGTATALRALVPNGSNHVGLLTNGRILNTASQPMLTHLETSNGHRVAAPPLSLEPEIHVSGRGQLAGGRAVVDMGADVADVIHHSDDHAYRVLITPTARCNGLAVTAKEQGSFVIQELMEGSSDATFDWLAVAHTRESLGSDQRAALPDRLPDIPSPSESEGHP